jgi:hypothetical protein
MAIRVNLGVSKKIGLPNYGSAGGHCNIEIEADNTVLEKPEEFQRRVQNAYELARQSVEDELAHHRSGTNATQSNEAPQQQQQQQQQEYRNNSSGNSGSGFAASPKQQQFIASLVKGVKGLDWNRLDRYCATKFGKTCSQLSSKEASALIEDLKNAKSGGGGLSA